MCTYLFSCILIEYVGSRHTRWQYLEAAVGLIRIQHIKIIGVPSLCRWESQLVTPADERRPLVCPDFTRL